jgi:hypothetical protein
MERYRWSLNHAASCLDIHFFSFLLSSYLFDDAERYSLHVCIALCYCLGLLPYEGIELVDADVNRISAYEYWSIYRYCVATEDLDILDVYYVLVISHILHYYVDVEQLCCMSRDLTTSGFLDRVASAAGRVKKPSLLPLLRAC